MTKEEALDIIDAVKVYSKNGDPNDIVYAFVSFMCLSHYLDDWECIDDVFYCDGKQLAP